MRKKFTFSANPFNGGNSIQPNRDVKSIIGCSIITSALGWGQIGCHNMWTVPDHKYWSLIFDQCNVSSKNAGTAAVSHPFQLKRKQFHLFGPQYLSGGGWVLLAGLCGSRFFLQLGFTSWRAPLRDSHASASFEIAIRFLLGGWMPSNELPAGRFGPISLWTRDRDTAGGT